MGLAYGDLLIRVRAWDQDQEHYPVEAALDDGSVFKDALRLDVAALRMVEPHAEAYGLALFNALFSGRIRTAYETAIARAEALTEGRVRVRLWIDDGAVELHALPWERLYHMHGGHALPLTTSEATPFSRYTGLELPEPPPVRARPLRMLAAIANPLKLGSLNLAPVDVEHEVETLRQALGDLRRKKEVEITLMPGRTGLTAELRARLEREGYRIQDGPTSLDNIMRHLRGRHVLHLIAHGRFRSAARAHGSDEAALFLEQEDGTWQIVKDADVVARLAQVRPLPHLVFLVACESAKRTAEAAHAFMGLAPRLVQAGVPAVVAMQDVVPMALARRLTSDFYRHLLEHGTIDRALNQARLLLSKSDEVDWATPVLFMRLEHGQILDLHPIEPISEPIPLTWNTFPGWLRAHASPTHLAGFLVVVIVLLAALLTLYRDATIYQLLFGPGQMHGDINIAIAEFGGLDDRGDPVRMADAYDLAETMYQSLQNDERLQQISGVDSVIDIWPPQRTGWIKGVTPDERALAAAELADRINADVIVYGTLQPGDDTSSFVAEFYLRKDKLPGAEELAGAYQLGSSISRPGNIHNSAVRRDLRKELLARTEAFIPFLFGLGYFELYDFDQAASYFQEARTTKGLDDPEGAAMLSLFLGTTANKRRDVATAEEYYNEALKAKPNYARALLGLGEVRYQRSRGANCTPGEVDAAGLNEAIRRYQSALNAPFPPQANVPIKTAFFVGRAYACLTHANAADHRADAQRELGTVIAAYNNGNSQVKQLASEAYANLGNLALAGVSGLARPQAEARYREAADHYRAAIAISRPEWSSYYALSLVFIHLGLKECEAAQQAWADANAAWEQAGKLYGDATRLNPDYETWRADIEKRWGTSSCAKPGQTQTSGGASV